MGYLNHCQRFGNRVIMAGHYYNGRNMPCYFGAVYEFFTEDTSCEGEIGIREVSGVSHTRMNLKIYNSRNQNKTGV